MRQTLDEIDEAHAVRLTGLSPRSRYPFACGHGGGACWLARHGCDTSADTDPATARLGWLDNGHGSARQAKRKVGLNDAQRAFARLASGPQRRTRADRQGTPRSHRSVPDGDRRILAAHAAHCARVPRGPQGPLLRGARVRREARQQWQHQLGTLRPTARAPGSASAP